jgi:NAD(P)-dependent dehydrogenase (short-subunit alcohol dehydrogenase family)
MTVTLITGANKGIGFETAKQLLELGHVVYLGARDAERGEKAAATLGAQFVQLDVTDDASVGKALATIGTDEGRLDVLVHNAGVLGDGTIDGPKALRVFDTNAVGIVRVTDHLPVALYSASKAAATMLTIQYAKSEPGIKFNAIEPGTTATDMTADFGIGRSPQESAAFVVRLATIGPDGPTGTFQDETGELPW